MKHFISFQKKKGIYLNNPTVESTQDYDIESEKNVLIHEINNELMGAGYFMSALLYKDLHKVSISELTSVYEDLTNGIKEIVGEGGYEPRYKNFPDSVRALSQDQFVINAILHYWTAGKFDPEGGEIIKRTYSREVKDYKVVGSITENEFNSIFTSILYSGKSISSFDKKVIDWFIANTTVTFDFTRITFKETLAYVGARLMNSSLSILPIRSASNVLRVYAAYSGGDEGLKENTKFSKLNNSQVRLLKATLDNCYDLEESFKTYREPWLKVLFYLNPLSKKNAKKYPTLFKYASLIRNNPKELKTFNSYVEYYIANKDEKIFTLLSKRPGMFSRRLNHLYDVFGELAITKYLELNVSFEKLGEVFNYFAQRNNGGNRSAILASSSSSSLVEYKELKPIHPVVLHSIKNKIITKMQETYRLPEFENKKVYIDPKLYFKPIPKNNRAASDSLASHSIGECIKYEGNAVIRAYVHWQGSNDIDLSGFCIDNKNNISKIGWDGLGSNRFLTYSGDNTGNYPKNSEYLDVDTRLVPENINWVIVDCNVYRGQTFDKWNKGKVLTGFQEVQNPSKSIKWNPSNTLNAMQLNTASKQCVLMAYHAPSKNIIYLDMDKAAMGNVSNANDATSIVTFLERNISVEQDDINWDKLMMGHLIELRSHKLVENEMEADIVFSSEHNSVDELLSIITK